MEHPISSPKTLIKALVSCLIRHIQVAINCCQKATISGMYSQKTTIGGKGLSKCREHWMNVYWLTIKAHKQGTVSLTDNVYT